MAQWVDSYIRRRREAIGMLLAERSDWQQSAIIERLAEQGITASQPTVSQDIAALGYVHTSRGEYVPHVMNEAELAEAEARERVRMHVHEIYEASPRVTCLRTDMGYAQGVGLALIGMRPHWGYMVITWGIDDVVIHSRSDIASHIRELMG